MNKSFFEQKIKNNPRPIIVEFWAPWCGPCKMMAPSLKQAEKEFEGQVDLWKINADKEPEILRDLGVRGIPTMIAYFEGEELSRKTGAMTPPQLHDFFSKVSEKEPFVRSLSWVQRVIRLAIASLVAYFAATNGPHYRLYWIL